MDRAREVLESIRDKKILLAFSGGKDALSVALLMLDMDIKFDAVCEESFYAAHVKRDIRKMRDELGINLTIKTSLSSDWVKRNSRVVFSDKSHVRSWSFSVRQQRTVKRYARERGYEVQVFGRRTEENSVRAHVYTTRAGLQCHPIRDWREREVWEWVDSKYRRPWIYGTRYGAIEGNAPFYTLNPRHVAGGLSACWDIVGELDPVFNPVDLGDTGEVVHG